VNGDLETRQRLLEASAQLFARRGFDDVTVREICRAARANLSAVNYHFHGKLGLYTEVVHTAIATIRRTSDAAREVGEGGTAEQKLRVYAHVFLERVAANGRESWIHQLINREMSDPTPAFDLIITRAIHPRIEYLSGLVGELLDCPPDDERVKKCVISIQAQLLFWLNPAIARVYPKFKLTPPAIDDLAEHIATLSIAGIRALRRHPSALPSAVPKIRRRRSATITEE
jgi:AcrR family transcriptional regulator